MGTDVEPKAILPGRIRELIRFHCLAGFDDAEDLRLEVEEAVRMQVVAYDDPELARWQEVVTEELALQAERVTSYPAVTDCQRLTEACEALTARGILAIERAGVETNGGWERFHDLVADWEEKGALAAVRGGCFYTDQDLARAMTEGRLWLTFGHVDDDDELVTELGRDIVDGLRTHGLSVEWNGSPDSRPEVLLRWQRRLAPAASTEPPEELCTFEEPPEGPPAELHQRVESRPGHSLVTLEGELTVETGEDLVAGLKDVPGHLVLDLRGLTRFTEDALSPLIALRKQRQQLALICPRELQQVLKATGMASLFLLCGSPEEAATHLG